MLLCFSSVAAAAAAILVCEFHSFGRLRPQAGRPLQARLASLAPKHPNDVHVVELISILLADGTTQGRD